MQILTWILLGDGKYVGIWENQEVFEINSILEINIALKKYKYCQKYVLQTSSTFNQ